eukprot:6216521-Pyramimonas_sp.AAC.1
MCIRDSFPGGPSCRPGLRHGRRGAAGGRQASGPSKEGPSTRAAHSTPATPRQGGQSVTGALVTRGPSSG